MAAANSFYIGECRLAAVHSLKHLKRSFLEKEDMAVWAKEITRSSDRAAAIMAYAYLDHALRIAITSRLEPYNGKDEKIKARLFEEYGVLYNTDAKIIMAHALGLYGDLTRANFDVLKSIRNTFAHSVHGITFNTPAISTQCKKLVRIPLRFRKGKGNHFRTNRDKYIYTVIDATLYIVGAGLADITRIFKPGEIPEGWTGLP